MDSPHQGGHDPEDCGRQAGQEDLRRPRAVDAQARQAGDRRRVRGVVGGGRRRGGRRRSGRGRRGDGREAHAPRARERRAAAEDGGVGRLRPRDADDDFSDDDDDDDDDAELGLPPKNGQLAGSACLPEPVLFDEFAGTFGAKCKWESFMSGIVSAFGAPQGGSFPDEFDS